jgi:hypothetical protein
MVPKKDHIFHGPDGQGYRVTRDCVPGEFIAPEMFEPLGGATEPKGGDPLPAWLAEQLAK